MPIKMALTEIPLPARRVFRLALVVALTLAASYALARPIPFIGPIFALILTLKPTGAIPAKGLIGILVLVSATLGIGLFLVPVLINYPAVGLTLVALGLFLANDLSLNRGKGTAGTFMTVGLTLITAAGTASFQMAVTVSSEILMGITLAVVCQRIAYFLFPEDSVQAGEASPPKPPGPDAANWISFRTVLIVFPTFLMGLINPAVYLPIIMKAVSLAQQSSEVHARQAGRELLVSTFLGGLYGIVFWFALKIHPTLWMFFLWILLFGIHFASKIYQISSTRFPPSVWVNVAVTMLILVGPAVADSANGKDVYKAFAVRITLFVAVTLYAWAAIILLEYLRRWKQSRRPTPNTEVN